MSLHAYEQKWNQSFSSKFLLFLKGTTLKGWMHIQMMLSAAQSIFGPCLEFGHQRGFAVTKESLSY